MKKVASINVSATADFWRGKRVLVTGAAGFIGSWVTEKLIEQGARVRATAMPNEPLLNIEQVRSAVELVSGDLADEEFVRRAVKECSVVFHLAAIRKNIKYHAEHPAAVLSANVEMTANVLEAAHCAGVSRVLLISSSRADDAWLTSPHFGYAWSKKIGEIFAEAYRREYGMSVIVVRAENTFGPRDHFDHAASQVIPALIRRIVTEQESPLRVVADPNDIKPFLYVEDTAEALIALAAGDETSAVIDVPASYCVSFSELVKSILRVSGLDLPVEFMPQKKLVNLETAENAATLYRIALPHSFEDSLRRTIEWYRKNKENCSVKSSQIINTKSKTILFGGSGFLGPVILGKYPDIISIGRNMPPSYVSNQHIHIDSLDDLHVLDSLNFDKVIFLIGSSDHHQINSNAMMGIDYNVIPLKKALAYFSKRQIKKFICFTTILLYDVNKMKSPVDETQPISPYINDYVLSKYLSEEIVEFYQKTVPSIIVRFTNIYGPTKLVRPDLVPTLIQNILSPKKEISVWNMKPIRDFLYLDDAAEAITKLIDTEYTGIVNFGTGKSVSIARISEILEKFSGKKIVDLKKEVSGPMNFQCDISLITKLTGWKPKHSIEDGLRLTYEKMKQWAPECRWWEKEELK